MKEIKNIFSKYGKFIIAVCAILMVVMCLLPAVKLEVKITDPITYSFFQVTFGTSSELDALGKVGFSVINLIALVLVVASVVAVFLVSSKNGALIAAICLLGAAVLFLLVPTFSSFVSELLDKSVSFADSGYKLGIGAILAAVIGFIGAGASALTFISSK